MNAIEVDLQHRFAGGFTLEVAFQVPSGVTALFGPSGVGKSSIIRAIAGLLRPARGRVVIGGKPVLDTAQGIWLPPWRRATGCVFQDARLFPHLTVAGNLRYGARWRKTTADFAEIVRLLDLPALLNRHPSTLSGGEAQRVAIGRALLSGAKMLICDEPLSGLGETAKDSILSHLERVRDVAQIPMIYVSHDLSETARLADTLVLLEGGKVVRSGPVISVLSDPELAPMIGVREAGSLIDGCVTAHAPDGLSVLETPSGAITVPRVNASAGTRIRLRIRAGDVVLARAHPGGVSALNILPGRVVSLVQGRGPGVMVGLQVGNARLLARITRRSCTTLELAPGAACFAIIKSVSLARRSLATRPGEHRLQDGVVGSDF